MDKPTAWTTAKLLMESGEDFYKIESVLKNVTPWHLGTIYQDGRSLWHVAIANRRIDVIEHIFDEYCRLPQSATVPYLHMACAYGFKEIVEILFEERPEEQCCLISVDDQHWKDFTTAHPYPYNEGDELFTRMASVMEKKKFICAYEVAALYKQVECLRTLLHEYPEDKWLIVIIARDQVLVLEMMLTIMDISNSALNYGFEESLKIKSPDCLEVILRYASKRGVTFSLANPYHFLYNEGSWCVGGSPAECTKILIRHGFDVNVMTQRATYPLYTLLESSIVVAVMWDYSHDKLMSEVSTCLAELLAGGADPNFNEAAYNDRPCTLNEENLIADNGKMKRLSCSSAVDLIDFEVSYSFLRSWHFDLIIQSVPLLVRYGSNISRSDTDGNTLLHKLLYHSAKTVYVRDNDSKDLSLMRKAVGTVLALGGDLQAVNNDMAMPMTGFLDKLMMRVDDQVDERVFYQSLLRRVKPVCSFLHVMEFDALCSVVRHSIRAIERGCYGVAHDALVSGLRTELLTYSRSVRSLYHSCLVKVWRCCGCKLTNLECLEIPNHVVHDLKKMLHLAGHN